MKYKYNIYYKEAKQYNFTEKAKFVLETIKAEMIIDPINNK
ncbi:hypothetical protein RHORCCE3_2079 [Rickettsia hoogstraalii str. RCCE3]|nr:hypothetical protein RHORCCE3_2079 [Rickettsia hoogstraalii str. RCCE3]